MLLLSYIRRYCQGVRIFRSSKLKRFVSWAIFFTFIGYISLHYVPSFSTLSQSQGKYSPKPGHYLIDPKGSKVTFNPGGHFYEDGDDEKVHFKHIDARCTVFNGENEIKSQIQALDLWDEMRKQPNLPEATPNHAYDAEKVKNESTLKVFVVPHSHADPGWLRTFESYGGDTNTILNNAITFLHEHPRMTFTWTETAFFDYWWTRQNDTTKNITKQLVQEGRLEFTGGAWVMTDEANPYFWASVDNIIEGHQYLMKEIGTIPKVSWSNDPFGYGPTVPFMFKKAGVDWLVINRFHRILKKKFSAEQTLHFYWRQIWDKQDTTKMLTHCLPYEHYDIPDTCGPDTQVCCQFDFKRLTHYPCGGPQPVPINADNVATKAATLYDQYRKFSKLYKDNVLLIMLGDDFRYDMLQEFYQQHDNYIQLFDYMNKKKEWNVEAQFGTMTKFFTTLTERSKTFPEFSGDFFPYNDVWNHLWTGYYTSRPHLKRMDRIVQAQIRAGDIFLALAAQKYKFSQLDAAIHDLLTSARRNLLIFQHHDAITGTAKVAVVVDYGKRLLDALRKASQALAASVSLLLGASEDSIEITDHQSSTTTQHNNPETSMLDTEPKFLQANLISVLMIKNKKQRFLHEYNSQKSQNEMPLVYNGLSSYFVLKLVQNKAKILAVTNSLPTTINETIRVRVDKSNVEVLETNTKNAVTVQINPVIQDLTGDVINNQYEVIFVAELQPLSISTFALLHRESVKEGTLAHAAVLKRAKDTLKIDSTFKLKDIESDIHLEGSHLLTVHDKVTGLLQSIQQGNTTLAAKLSFWEYENTASGSYLFMPSNAAKAWKGSVQKVVAFVGPLLSEIHTIYENSKIHHILTVYKTQDLNGQQIFVRNVVNLKDLPSNELVMRINTDVKNDNVFYTDMNGYQILKRHYYDKARIEENYYPMPSTIFIQDKTFRFTVLSGQPHGASGYTPGGLEIMLDRISHVDDNKGMGDLMRDNVPTASHFRLLLEPLLNLPEHQSRISGHSTLGNLALDHLLNPGTVLHFKKDNTAGKMASSFNPLSASFPCGMQLVNLRHLLAKGGGVVPDELMVLHQRETDCAVKLPNWLASSCADLTDAAYYDLIKALKIAKLQETSLSGVHSKQSLKNALDAFALQPLDIRAFKIVR